MTERIDMAGLLAVRSFVARVTNRCQTARLEGEPITHERATITELEQLERELQYEPWPAHLSHRRD